MFKSSRSVSLFRSHFLWHPLWHRLRRHHLAALLVLALLAINPAARGLAISWPELTSVEPQGQSNP